MRLAESVYAMWLQRGSFAFGAAPLLAHSLSELIRFSSSFAFRADGRRGADGRRRRGGADGRGRREQQLGPTEPGTDWAVETWTKALPLYRADLTPQGFGTYSPGLRNLLSGLPEVSLLVMGGCRNPLLEFRTETLGSAPLLQGGAAVSSLYPAYIQPGNSWI